MKAQETGNMILCMASPSSLHTIPVSSIGTSVCKLKHANSLAICVCPRASLYSGTPLSGTIGTNNIENNNTMPTRKMPEAHELGYLASLVATQALPTFQHGEEPGYEANTSI